MTLFSRAWPRAIPRISCGDKPYLRLEAKKLVRGRARVSVFALASF
jgi:hypothetical protein